MFEKGKFSTKSYVI